jgi:hypothetical protein
MVQREIHSRDRGHSLPTRRTAARPVGLIIVMKSPPAASKFAAHGFSRSVAEVLRRCLLSDCLLRKIAPGATLEIYPDVAAQRELLPTDTGGRGGLIDPAALPTRAPLCVEMNLGDVLLISAFTPHRSTPNLTPLARWSLDLRFQPTGTHSGRGQLPSFTVRSASDPGAVERDRGFDRWCARWAAAT